MNCRTCNSSNVETARFCLNCGAELRVRNPLPPPTPIQKAEITRQHSGGRGEEATLVIRDNDPLCDSTIAGKYRIDAKLGSGGMGAVYRATRLLIGDTVAVKILHSEQRDASAPERFRREAQAAARLKHPNAVNIYDFGVTDDGLQYLVMELVEGQSLRDIIRRDGAVTPSATVEIIDQVCAALDEAHRHNIIHRDIKPDNIIVDINAAKLRVKVLDFGIAKLRDDVAGNLTQVGSLLGTPHYMSPEQCLGEEVDGRSDVYSLGVVVYEMLTGTVPFKSPSAAAVVVQHVNQLPVQPRLLNPSIPPAMEVAMLHALEKRREDRPQTAGALAAELANALRYPDERGRPPVAMPSANQIGPAPTLILNQPQFSTAPGTSQNVGQSTLGFQTRNNTTRTVGLTVLATVLLLGVGGLAARMLFSSSAERADTPAQLSSSPQKESAASNETPRVAQAPTALPVPTVNVPPANTSSLKQGVLETLNGWAGAARAHDLDGQMSYYADTVDPYFLKRNASAAYVRSTRSLAFTRYSKLDVQLSNIDIAVDQSGASATATFDKTYSFEGDKLLSGSVKTMLWLTRSGSRWLISGERDVKVYYVNK